MVRHRISAMCALQRRRITHIYLWTVAKNRIHVRKKIPPKKCTLKNNLLTLTSFDLMTSIKFVTCRIFHLGESIIRTSASDTSDGLLARLQLFGLSLVQYIVYRGLILLILLYISALLHWCTWIDKIFFCCTFVFHLIFLL